MQQYKYTRDGMIPVSNGDWIKKEELEKENLKEDRSRLGDPDLEQEMKECIEGYKKKIKPVVYQTNV